jgi:hypothetical protein
LTAGSFATAAIGLVVIGNEVTIPKPAFASLKPSFSERRMPGPNEMR